MTERSAVQASAPLPTPPLELAEPYRRALVVANPIAGRGLGETVGRDVSAGLSRLGIATELYLTRARGDARARLRGQREPVDLVVSVGGDGSLREVLDGLMDPATPVAMVPLGTANVLALDLGLERNVDRALEIIAGRRLQRLDVARVNGHLSFLVTGVGFDGAVVREVERARTGPISKWSYSRAIVRALRGYRAPRLEVELDGEPLDGRFGLVLIANIIHYGGSLKLSRHRRLDDGRFEAYLFPGADPRHLVALALRGFVSELPGGSCTMHLCSRAKVVSDDGPVPYQVDGDFRGETPVEFEVLRRQHRILIP
ncbi:MAG: NAD(+)/NADH kinase [Planctomycetes bacterium]|nr:NAD(+)/NADH kinase [Planctomycetota bacterium]